MKRRAGFTLIEILVVVSIIALLISITMPAFAESRRVSKKTVCLHNLHEIGIALHAYLQAHQDTFPYVSGFPSKEADIAQTQNRKPYPSLPMALKSETGGNSQMFLCPSDQITDSKLLSDPQVMRFGSRYFDSQFSSYQFFTELNGMKLNPRTLKILAGSLSLLLKDIPMASDYEVFHGDPAKPGTYNQLYVDFVPRSDKKK